MIKAILLDLDNTLLFNPDAVFVKAYIEQFEDFLVRQHGAADYRAAIRAAIKTVNDHKRDITLTIQQHILAEIAQSTQVSVKDLQDSGQEFYQDIFPSLRNCTQTINPAKALVSALMEQSYAVIIATNPLYPYEGIHQRLEWAGISDENIDYAFITHAENMHFAKPNPAYYAEIIARVGVEPDEALMIGNNLNHDIQPAQQVGLHVMHLHPDATPDQLAHGLRAVHESIVQSGWGESVPLLAHHPAMIEPQYWGNLGALTGMLESIPDHFWDQHPDPDEWSPRQIIRHLLDSEKQVQRPRLEHILHEDNPFLANPNPPPGPRDFHCERSGLQLAQAFILARKETMALLRTLSPSDWQRPARHSIFGPTTLLEMAYFTAQHDRLHLNQLCQTLGKCA